MKQVKVSAQIDSWRATDAYARISDFPSYPQFSTAVRSIQILEEHPGHIVSAWEVNFRQGILQWTEEDRFDEAALTIDFKQIEGDAEHFSGQWQISEANHMCQVQFVAAFDMGIPALDDIIEPIAERALQENIKSIIEGLFQTKIEYL